ncbi:hypothetical protein I5100_00005 [Staphylococcus haemolyticus]|uniref:hypothetical protein n=1 Tax=Staphylococcus haemolyticus TaxID=1283 RepID=UPI0019173938|nr:hypothetical protein [Staphylococcus haemolyticus]QQQ84399.1 hypothetical protein I5100_00005 [Staphylococcus haemolyticus]
MSEQEIWKKVLEVAESEISKSTFNTFLKADIRILVLIQFYLVIIQATTTI